MHPRPGSPGTEGAAGAKGLERNSREPRDRTGPRPVRQPPHPTPRPRATPYKGPVTRRVPANPRRARPRVSPAPPPAAAPALSPSRPAGLRLLRALWYAQPLQACDPRASRSAPRTRGAQSQPARWGLRQPSLARNPAVPQPAQPARPHGEPFGSSLSEPTAPSPRKHRQRQDAPAGVGGSSPGFPLVSTPQSGRPRRQLPSPSLPTPAASEAWAPRRPRLPSGSRHPCRRCFDDRGLRFSPCQRAPQPWVIYRTLNLLQNLNSEIPCSAIHAIKM